MRSRQANAATARAFSLVIEPGFDPSRAGLVLADVTDPRALEEAIMHLGASLFDDEDDRVAADATDVLVRALRRHRIACAA